VSFLARYRGVLNAFATLISGPMYSFGSNANGRTGLNIPPETLVPTQVGSLTTWSEVAGGDTHSLAIEGGKLYSFGGNANGRTGLNTTVGETIVPTQVGSLTTWEKISGGGFHALAVNKI